MLGKDDESYEQCIKLEDEEEGKSGFSLIYS